MFYYVKGELVHAGDGFAVVDCGGIGYKITVSATTLSALPVSEMQTGCPEVKLLTYLLVREDALELFGFYTSEELDIFKLLIGVSGVGPKAAMSILSLLPPASLADAITSQNVKMISRAPGVGVKTAQRIVLELSGKLITVADTASNGRSPSAPRSASLGEAQDALMVLGYTRAEAQSALKSVPDAQDKSTEELIKSALSRLM